MDEKKKLENYLEFRIPVKKDAGWKNFSEEVRSALKAAKIPFTWQWRFHHHMTILYLDNNECVDQLTQGFAKCLSGLSAFPLSIDKLDAFTTGMGDKHIICLTTTQLPEQISTLAQDTRTLADGLNAAHDHRTFKPHITLGQVSVDKCSLEKLQAVLRTVRQPAFNVPLTIAEHRYRSGDVIKSWKLP